MQDFLVWLFITVAQLISGFFQKKLFHSSCRLGVCGEKWLQNLPMSLSWTGTISGKKSVIWCHYSNQLSIWAIASWLPLVSEGHLVALLHSIHTIRKKVIVLRFPRKYEPEEKFYVLQIYYSVWLQKQACKRGTEARWEEKWIWWIVI